jgi:hypothetical protein
MKTIQDRIYFPDEIEVKANEDTKEFQVKKVLENPCKSVPGVNFINILLSNFSHENALCSFSLVTKPKRN